MKRRTVNETVNERLTSIFMHKLDPNHRSRNHKRPTPIYHAISKNNPVLVTTLLELGADPNPKIKYGNYMTPLMFSVSLKHIEIVEILLDYGADPNGENSYLEDAMDVAINVRSAECVRILLEYGAFLNEDQRTEYYNTHDDVYVERRYFCSHRLDPIKLAIGRGLIEIVKVLIEYGEDFDNFKGRYGYTVFTLAMYQIKCPKKCIQMMRYLMTIGQSVNQYDRDTPLCYAVRKRKMAYVEFLVKAGSNINHIDNNKYTPLMRAVENNDISMVKYLLAAGADANIGNKYGWTAGHYSVENRLNPEIITMLLDANIGIDIKENHGLTMIDMVLRNNDATPDERKDTIALIETGIMMTKGVFCEDDLK